MHKPENEMFEPITHVTGKRLEVEMVIPEVPPEVLLVTNMKQLCRQSVERKTNKQKRAILGIIQDGCLKNTKTTSSHQLAQLCSFLTALKSHDHYQTILFFKLSLYKCRQLIKYMKVFDYSWSMSFLDITRPFVARFCLFCAFSSPRYQVSVYRTIGPLFLIFILNQRVWVLF